MERRISEMAVRMNRKAYDLMNLETKAAFSELFNDCRFDGSEWYILRGRSLARDEGDLAWRLFDDFVDFACDDSQGAFLEFAMVFQGGGSRTYSNRTSSDFTDLLSVQSVVMFNGRPVSAMFN